MQQVVQGPNAAPDQLATYKRYLYGRVSLPPCLYGKDQRPFVYGVTSSPLVGIATNYTYGQASIQINNDSYFLVEAINIWPRVTTTSSGDLIQSIPQRSLLDVQITDQTYGKSWSNSPVNLLDIAGLMGANTKYLKDPFLIAPNTVLQIALRDRLGNGNTVSFYIGLIGRKVYGLSDAEYRLAQKRQWFQYVMPSLGTTSNGGVVSGNLPKGSAETIQNLQLFSDADFILKKIYASDFFFLIAAVNFTVPSATVDCILNIRNTSKDRSFFSKQISIRSTAGTMQPYTFVSVSGIGDFAGTIIGNGFEFRRPLFIPRNSILEFRMYNPDAANDLSAAAASITPGQPLRLTMEGINIYT